MLKSQLLTLLSCLILLASGCNRRGCIDSDAVNFEPTAVTDCGCCYYYGKIYIWYKDGFYGSLLGCSKLFYYANGVLVGESTQNLSSYNYYQSPPPVNSDYYTIYNADDGNILTASLGNLKTKTMDVVIKDEFQNIRWSGTMTFKANQVIVVELM